MSEQKAANELDSNKAPNNGADPSQVLFIRHFPVTMFAGVLGLCGIGLAWRQAALILELPNIVGEAILGFTAGYSVAIYLLYGIKCLRFLQDVKEEYWHGVRGNYFAAGGMSLMLLAAAALPYAPVIAEILWFAGIVLTVVITVFILRIWIDKPKPIEQMTPARLIPVLGGTIAPIAGASLEYDMLSWMFLGTGLLFWVMLLTIFFYRILAAGPVSDALRPMMFLLVTPPALGAVGITALSGGYMDASVKMLLGITCFMALLLLQRTRRFARSPFGMPWWSCGFAFSSLALASVLYHEHAGDGISLAILYALLAIASVINLALLVLTLKAFATGHLFRAPES